MSRSNVEEVLPLAPLQEGLLVHALMDGEGQHQDVYTVQTVVRLDGEVDPVRLRAAAQSLIDRHAVLRAAFVLDGGGAMQVVLRRLDVPWAVVDVAAGASLDAELEACCRAERRRPFVMDEPPLIRFTLLRGPGESRLVISSHHILLDGWSGPLLLRDLFALYAGQRLPPARPFRDYLAWLGARDRKVSLARWEDLLSGTDSPTLVAGTGPGPSPADAATLPGVVAVPLDPRTGPRIADLARSCGVTASTVLQAAWALVLARSTGRDDVVFGTTVSGRPPEIPGVESIVGMFINTVPVRVRLPAALTVAGLLGRMHEDQTRTLEHQYLGLAEVQALAGVGDLFDTLMVVESYPVDDGEIDRVRAALDVRTTGVDTQDGTHYPVTVVAELGAHPTLALEYRPDRIPAEQAVTLAQRWGRTVDALVDGGPDLPLGRVAVLPQAERDTFRGEPGPRVAVPHGTIVDLFAAAVALGPAAPAVVCGGDRLSFGELADRSDRLATHLVSLGIGPESPVGVVLPRSVDVVVAMLAIWKAGGTVVTTDPRQPADRVRSVLAQAAPQVVLTSADLRATAGSTGRVLVDATFPDSWTGTGHLRTDHDPRSAAYLIFTSGSTGRPKGVTATHAGVVNLFAAHRRALMDPESARHGRRLRVSNVLSFAYDGSIDPLTWMLAGHELHILTDDRMGDPAGIVAHVRRDRIDVVDVPPSLLELVLEEGLLAPDAHRPGLVATGAEAVGPGLWNDLAAGAAGGTGAVNLYGPTECTVDALWAPVEPQVAPHIGGALANCRAYVLGPDLEPVPTGFPGELHVAGPGLARGYAGDPRATAGRFVADPFGSRYGDPGARMYRTGDLVRRNHSGTIEFLGRLDDQVKIRGVRVEPAEVESALAGLPGIRQAAVVARVDAGITRLVGYVTLDGTLPVRPEELRTALAATLPAPMVPSAVEVLDRMPSTPNGKLDRRALPAPAPDGGGPVGRAPADATERRLHEIFAALLGTERFGVDDSFFDLGGHSLLAARLVSRVRDELSARLSIRAVFTSPTVAGLAGLLGAEDGAAEPGRDGSLDALLRLRPEGTGTPLFCIHPGLGLSWSYAALLPHLGGDVPVFGLQATGFDPDGDGLELDDVARRYADVVQDAAPDGPIHLLGWSLGAVLAHPVARLLEAAGRSVPRVVLLDGYPDAGDAAEPDPPETAGNGRSRFLHTWLERAGHDVTGVDPDRLDPASAAALAARQEGMLSGLSAERIEALAGSMRAVANVGTGRLTGCIGSDVVLITTTSEPPADWSRHVSGRLDVHRVDVEHEDLLTPRSLSTIGPLIAAALRPPTP
jgi:amino acid adenylation domain-containing protein